MNETLTLAQTQISHWMPLITLSEERRLSSFVLGDLMQRMFPAFRPLAEGPPLLRHVHLTGKIVILTSTSTTSTTLLLSTQ